MTGQLVFRRLLALHEFDPVPAVWCAGTLGAGCAGSARPRTEVRSHLSIRRGARLIPSNRYNSETVARTSRRDFLAANSAVLPWSLAARLRGASRTKFRLAVTTDEIDDDLAVALAFLQRHRLQYCEIRELWDRYNTSLPVAKIREARRMLDDAGIRLAILDTAFFKVPLPAAGSVAGAQALEGQWRLLDRAFERASILGAHLIRTFAFTHKRGETPDASSYPWIYDLVEESAERARKAGFRLALENVADSYVATAAHSADLLRAVRSPALGLTWDPNNSARARDPEPFPAGYEALDSNRIWHVHFRDYRRRSDGAVEWCGVGDGEFDHVGQLRALLRDGYAGAVSLETHYRIRGSKAEASAHSLRGLLEAVGRV